MRLAETLVFVALLTACAAAPAAAQIPSGAAGADHTPVGLSELYAMDAERVARAERLLERQDVDRYDMAVCVDPERGWMSGECVIGVRCGSGPLRLLLDEALSLTSLRSAGGGPVSHERIGGEIHVVLAPDPSGDTRTLEFRYEGPLPGDREAGAAGGFAFLDAGHHWYPSPPEYDAATFRITVRYPEGYSSVCTGSLVGMAPLRETSRGRCAVGDVWAAETPIPAAAVVVGRFVSSLRVSGDVFLGYHWIERPDAPLRRTSAPERGINELVRFLESCYGPYPYEWLNVVSAPTAMLGGRSAVSAPGLVAIDENVWERSDGRGYNLARLGAGLSRSWWRFSMDAGPAVAEGLAGHSAVSWHEARGDQEEALRVRDERRAEYLRALVDSGGRATLRSCFGAPPGDVRICRGKGTQVFGLLETVIGRDAFCAALRALAARGAGPVGFESVVRAFEDSTGEPLEWFFDEWFSRGDLPTYTLEYEVASRSGGPVVRGVIRQDGEIYRTPVPLTVDLGGWSYDEWVPIESAEQRFEFRTEMVPMEIVVDGGHLIPLIEKPELARAHFQRGLDASKAGDWDVAVNEFGAAAALEGDRAQYRFRYGDALVHSGQVAAGIEALEGAVELAPANAEYRLALARLYLGAREYERALSHFDQYVSLRPDPRGRLGRARSLIGLDRLDEARRVIDRARAEIEATGSSNAIREELFLVLGRFHEAAGDAAAAVSAYERALELDPMSDEARSRLQALSAE
jgi:tetratricopeptide (TPR) repeat protein